MSYTESTMPKIEFPEYEEGSKREFISLGLTPEEVESVLAERYGLTEGLRKHFPDRVLRGKASRSAELTSTFKALYAFEHLGRDCSYAQIADAMEINPDSAYQYMVQARHAVEVCFGLNILTAKEQVRLVSQDDLRERTVRFVNFIEDKVVPQMNKVQVFAASLKQANQAVLLPARAAAFLQAASTVNDGQVQF
jgi:hypothetical protein